VKKPVRMSPGRLFVWGPRYGTRCNPLSRFFTVLERDKGTLNTMLALENFFWRRGLVVEERRNLFHFDGDYDKRLGSSRARRYIVNTYTDQYCTTKSDIVN
jgi:hypothetical protein